jgi:hypothetical protein
VHGAPDTHHLSAWGRKSHESRRWCTVHQGAKASPVLIVGARCTQCQDHQVRRGQARSSGLDAADGLRRWCTVHQGARLSVSGSLVHGAPRTQLALARVVGARCTKEEIGVGPGRWCTVHQGRNWCWFESLVHRAPRAKLALVRVVGARCTNADPASPVEVGRQGRGAYPHRVAHHPGHEPARRPATLGGSPRLAPAGRSGRSLGRDPQQGRGARRRDQGWISDASSARSEGSSCSGASRARRSRSRHRASSPALPAAR